MVSSIFGHGGCAMAQIYAEKNGAPRLCCWWHDFWISNVHHPQRPQAETWCSQLYIFWWYPPSLCLQGLSMWTWIPAPELICHDIKRLYSGITHGLHGHSSCFLDPLPFLHHLSPDHVVSAALSGITTPIKEATGVKDDISPLLICIGGNLPSQPKWCSLYQLWGIRHMVQHCQHSRGDILTYIVLTDNMQQVIAWTNVHSSKDPNNPDLCARSGVGEGLPKFTMFSSSDLTGLVIDPPNLKQPCSLQSWWAHLSHFHLWHTQWVQFWASVTRMILDDDAVNRQRDKIPCQSVHWWTWGDHHLQQAQQDHWGSK